MKYLGLDKLQEFLNKVKQYVTKKIEDIPDPMHYAGTWAAASNSPELVPEDASKAGYVYRVSQAGTQFGITFKIGDRLVYNESGIAEKWDTTDEVYSVNGKQGDVVISKADIGLGDVNNTSDVNKPISNAVRNEFGKAILFKGNIPEGTDVNTLTSNGYWHVGASIVPTLVNMPDVDKAHDGIFIVTTTPPSSPYYIKQEYIAVNLNRIFTRSKEGGDAWTTTWKELACKKDLPEIVQSTGTSSTAIISQKGVTDAISNNLKFKGECFFEQGGTLKIVGTDDILNYYNSSLGNSIFLVTNDGEWIESTLPSNYPIYFKTGDLLMYDLTGHAVHLSTSVKKERVVIPDLNNDSVVLALTNVVAAHIEKETRILFVNGGSTLIGKYSIAYSSGNSEIKAFSGTGEHPVLKIDTAPLAVVSVEVMTEFGLARIYCTKVNDEYQVLVEDVLVF